MEVWRYRASGAETIAVMRNPEVQAGSEGPVRDSGSEALEKPEKINVRWPKPARVKDLRSGRVVGLTDRVTAELDPWSPLILELRRGMGKGAGHVIEPGGELRRTTAPMRRTVPAVEGRGPGFPEAKEEVAEIAGVRTPRPHAEGPDMRTGRPHSGKPPALDVLFQPMRNSTGHSLMIVAHTPGRGGTRRCD